MSEIEYADDPDEDTFDAVEPLGDCVMCHLVPATTRVLGEADSLGTELWDVCDECEDTLYQERGILLNEALRKKQASMR